MFETLVESRERHRRPLAQTTTSVAVHAAIIFFAVTEVHGSADPVSAITDTSVVFIAPRHVPLTHSTDRPDGGAPSPIGFPTVVPVIDIPPNLPPITLTHQPFDPRAFTGRGVAGGAPDGIGIAGASPDVGSLIVSSAEADEPPRLVTSAALRAPAGFEGVSGRVVLSFIVDTLGRAEAGSVKVIASSSPVFEQPATAMVLGSRFTPGRNGGRPVRVLVQQPVVFQAQ
jgi:TonB family protein